MMSNQGIRGPVTTGVGSLPWTWPRDEQIIDLIHKGVYAFVTGAIADALVGKPNQGSLHVGVGNLGSGHNRLNISLLKYFF